MGSERLYSSKTNRKEKGFKRKKKKIIKCNGKVKFNQFITIEINKKYQYHIQPMGMDFSTIKGSEGFETSSKFEIEVIDEKKEKKVKLLCNGNLVHVLEIDDDEIDINCWADSDLWKNVVII
jgi:hypothetical protein